MKDLSGFYSVVAGVCFTLLGLWWVAVQERPDLRRRETGGSRLAYLVSLQFSLPGTAALLSQVAPEVVAFWRTAFVAAGVIGALAVIYLAPGLHSAGARTPARILLLGGVPLYAVIAVVAAVPQIGPGIGLALNGAQVEGLLFGLQILLSAQIAWIAAMSSDFGTKASAATK